MKAIIGILWHPLSIAWRRREYLIHQHSTIWKEDGFDVRHFRKPEEANRICDLVIVHSDVSCIDPAWLTPLKNHKLVLNRNVVNIRKTHVSDLILTQDSNWAGPVVIKTDLNNNGKPERWVLDRKGFKRGVLNPFRDHYSFLNSISEVPQSIWRNPNYVVEQFQKESWGDDFATTSATIFGDEVSCVKLGGKDWEVKAKKATNWERIPTVPDEVIQKRKSLGLDYGKIDYTQNADGIHIFDINKTIGRITLHSEHESNGRRLTKSRLRKRGQVILRYLEGEITPFVLEK
jgi:hypothetical protein